MQVGRRSDRRHRQGRRSDQIRSGSHHTYRSRSVRIRHHYGDSDSDVCARRYQYTYHRRSRAAYVHGRPRPGGSPAGWGRAHAHVAIGVPAYHAARPVAARAAGGQACDTAPRPVGVCLSAIVSDRYLLACRCPLLLLLLLAAGAGRWVVGGAGAGRAAAALTRVSSSRSWSTTLGPGLPRAVLDSASLAPSLRIVLHRSTTPTSSCKTFVCK